MGSTLDQRVCVFSLSSRSELKLDFMGAFGKTSLAISIISSLYDVELENVGHVLFRGQGTFDWWFIVDFGHSFAAVSLTSIDILNLWSGRGHHLFLLTLLLVFCGEGFLFLTFSILTLHLADVDVALHLGAPVGHHGVFNFRPELGPYLAQNRAHVHLVLAISHHQLLLGKILLHLKLELIGRSIVHGLWIARLPSLGVRSAQGLAQKRIRGHLSHRSRSTTM